MDQTRWSYWGHQTLRKQALQQRFLEAEPKPTPAFVRRARVAVLVAVWRCQRAEALSQGDALGARPIELQERLGWDGQRVDLSR